MSSSRQQPPAENSNFQGIPDDQNLQRIRQDSTIDYDDSSANGSDPSSLPVRRSLQTSSYSSNYNSLSEYRRDTEAMMNGRSQAEERNYVRRSRDFLPAPSSGHDYHRNTPPINYSRQSYDDYRRSSVGGYNRSDYGGQENVPLSRSQSRLSISDSKYESFARVESSLDSRKPLVLPRLSEKRDYRVVHDPFLADPSDKSLKKEVIMRKTDDKLDNYPVRFYGDPRRQRVDGKVSQKRMIKRTSLKTCKFEVDTNWIGAEPDPAVFVSNLPEEMSSESIRRYFTQISPVKSCSLVAEPDTGKSCRKCRVVFVNMDRDRDIRKRFQSGKVLARDICQSYNGKPVNGQIVRIDYDPYGFKLLQALHVARQEAEDRAKKKTDQAIMDVDKNDYRRRLPSDSNLPFDRGGTTPSLPRTNTVPVKTEREKFDDYAKNSKKPAILISSVELPFNIRGISDSVRNAFRTYRPSLTFHDSENWFIEFDTVESCLKCANDFRGRSIDGHRISDIRTRNTQLSIKTESQHIGQVSSHSRKANENELPIKSMDDLMMRVGKRFRNDLAHTLINDLKQKLLPKIIYDTIRKFLHEESLYENRNDNQPSQMELDHSPRTPPSTHSPIEKHEPNQEADLTSLPSFKKRSSILDRYIERSSKKRRKVEKEPKKRASPVVVQVTTIVDTDIEDTESIISSTAGHLSQDILPAAPLPIEPEPVIVKSPPAEPLLDRIKRLLAQSTPSTDSQKQPINLESLDYEDFKYMALALQQFCRAKPPALPDSSTKHKSGSARTEGYYKISSAEKLNYLVHRNKVLPDENNNVQNLGPKLSSRNARVDHRRVLVTIEEAKQTTNSDILKFNQLQARKKHLKFAQSAIHDWGLFALEKIEVNDMVIEYIGEVIRQKVADHREKTYEKMGIGSSYLFRVDEDEIIDATKMGNLARFINHSCEPNCIAKIITVDNDKKIVIYAKRDIEIGEEIVYDYKFPIEDDKIPCLCGATTCRGTLN